jgi:hypothetical protein
MLDYDNAKGDGSSTVVSTPKRTSISKSNIYAAASPSLATKAGVSSSAPPKYSLHTSETGKASMLKKKKTSPSLF